MISRTTLMLSTAFAALAFPGVAAAQETAAAATEAQATAATAAADRDEEGEMIVVTATKRAEPILDIPQSVTVIGGDTLDRQHAVTFQDYLSQVPGLSMEQSEPGVGRIALRGVNTGGVSSTVAVYVDETPFGSSTGLVNGAILAGDFDTFDISRIEVLRGPQGTLYGANSLGGVLKFVTNLPELGKLSARGRVGIEFIDEGGTGYNASGVLNVPLGDTAAFRGSGFYRKNAGWVNANGANATFLGVPTLDGKDINEGQVWGGRGSILFEPTDKLSVRLTAMLQHIESDAPSDVEVDPEDYDPIDGELNQTVFIREPNELKYRVFNGTIEYDFGFASLLSSTSFSKQDQTFRTDLTPVYGGAFNFYFGPLNPNIPPFFPAPITDEVIGGFQDQQTDLKKFTQEIRLASPSNDTIEWMAGLYYNHEEGKIDQFIAGLALATGEPFTDPVLSNLASLRLDSKYQEIAGFANATWHVTDRFDVTAGARWSKNEQEATQNGEGHPLLVPGGDASNPTIKSDESVFTYSLSPRFDISDSTAVYARIAKGYRPGGPNVIPPTADASVPRTYSADTLTSYEIGLKSDFGRRASLDIAAYHLDWDDIQLFTVVDGFGLNANGSTAVSNGIEGTLQLRPMTGLQLGVNAAWIDAHLTGDTPPLTGGFDGDRLPYVPKTAFSLTADYEWALSNSVTAYVGGTIAYTGSQRDNFVQSDIVGIDPDTGDYIFEFFPQRRISDYAAVDLRAGVETGAFILEAYVKNLTNTRGVQSIAPLEDLVLGNVLPDNAIRASLSRPRAIGFSLTAGF